VTPAAGAADRGRQPARRKGRRADRGTRRSIYLPPWRIDVVVDPGVARILPVTRRSLARSIAAAFEAASAPHPASVGLTLAGDRELASLNADHMGHAGATDVLSFPLLPAERFARSRATPVSAPAPEFVLPPRVRVNLGDIVVSVERAIDQAHAGRGGQTGDVRWSPADEMRLLVTHGALHLCGWDHADPDEEAAMRALEGRLLGPVSGSREG
jgi:probable rRNA maturation factor